MKHILVCLLAAVLLFSYIGQNTVLVKAQATNATPLATGAAAVARAAVTAASPIVATKEQEKPVEQQIGLLLSHADTLEGARFKNGFEKSIPKEIKLNSLDAAGSADAQKTMFNKMVEQKFSVIVLDLMSLADVDYYVETAGQAGVPLVFIGNNEPTLEQLNKYPSIYFAGFHKSNMTELMAQETTRLWNANPALMNFEEDEWDLTYSAITKDGFGASGSSRVFKSAMEAAGISVSMAVDSVVQPLEYDLIDEVDQTVIDDSEIVFFDNSTDVQRALEFFYDPTEFKKGRPSQQFALTTIDDGAAKLIEDGEVLFAIGTSPKELGQLAAELAQLLAINPLSNLQTLEKQPTNDRFFYLPATILRADIKPEPVEEPAEDDTKK